MLIVQFVLFGCVFGFSDAGLEDGWSYNDIAAWARNFPNCGGQRQSPINIVQSDVQYSLSLALLPVYFHGFSRRRGKEFEVENNGKTFEVHVASARARIVLVGLGIYNFEQFHFHWGSDDSRGSEHQINGKIYPAEMHLVHYNNRYSSFEEAKDKPNGLAVLAVFIERGAENPVFDKFLDLDKYDVIEKESSVMVEAFPLIDLLPSRRNYYRYEGSLTTPTCDETVTWTVFDEPIEISERQLEEFRKLKTHDGEPLVNNFRPVQDLNCRTVTSNFRRNGGSINIFKPFSYSCDTVV